MHPKVHPLAGKRDTFEFESKPLLEGRIEAELDLSASTDYALPRERIGGLIPEQARDGTVIERISRSSGNLTIRRNLALGNRTDHLAERVVAKLVGAHAVTLNATLQFAAGLGRGARAVRAEAFRATHRYKTC